MMARTVILKKFKSNGNIVSSNLRTKL